MKPKTCVLAAVSMLLLASLVFAQDLRNRPVPDTPVNILGAQLIAWSQLQKPQPVPQPMPESAPSVHSDQQLVQSTSPSARPQQQPPAAQTLRGTVVKDGGRYILNVSNSNAYELDDPETAKQFEGKQVRIAGTLDVRGNSFHVMSIEPIS